MPFMSNFQFILKIAPSQLKVAFDSWKDNEYFNSNKIHNNYHSKGKDYPLCLGFFLNQVEIYRIKSFARQ